MNDMFDFGFTTVDEEALDNSKNVIEDLSANNENLASEVEFYKQNMEGLRNLIMPLLNNLMKNPEKDYIHWPDREEKIKAFIEKLDNYFEEF
jgi:predicted RNase H-like nuclease (RuvC/YqgF family)